jgi:hypothetical protein
MTALDPRSERIAIVSVEDFAALLSALRADGYGLMQLPPATLGPEDAGDALVQLAEQVAEYRRNGYEVVLAGDGAPWRAELDEALARAGVPVLPAVPL